MALSPSELNDLEFQKAMHDSSDITVDGQHFRKLFVTGRSEAGKTTLIQALKGEQLGYDKTQYVNSWDAFIDTPGEYIENKLMGSVAALYVFSFESDVDGVLVGADEPFSILNPGIPTAVNRPFIGIITKCDEPKANVPMARLWLENAGVQRIFEVDSVTGRGIDELKEFLLRPVDKKMSLDEAIRRQSCGEPEFDDYKINYDKK